MNNHLKKIIRDNLPSFVVKAGKRIKKNYRRKRLEDKKKKMQVVDKNILIKDLQNIGITEGDSVLVHSSLSKMGYVDGGPQTFIDAVLKTIGNNGTLLLPAFPGNTFNKEYLLQKPVFNIKETPSKMGSITELFRNLPGVKRSFHPTDSVCALGPLAGYYIKDHFGQLTPYNKFSPFYKLCEKKGKIVMIGVMLDTCTNLHTLEDAVDFKFPVYDSKIFEVHMIDEEGKEHIMKTKVHNPVYSKKRMCDQLIPLFEKEGVLIHGKVGEAPAMLIDAKGMLDVMIEHYQKRGVTMYTPYGS